MSEVMPLPRVGQSLPFTCGASCFASMYEFLKGEVFGEMYFAEKLETIKLGYTPPENIVALAKTYGLQAELIEDAPITVIQKSLKDRAVVFVTWWDEDAGHYSLVKGLNAEHITLMDPLLETDNQLTLEYFIPNWKTRGAKVILVTA